MGHYDLARFWSARRDAERAFAQWTLGHRVLARFQPFSRTAYKSFVDATIANFDAARMTHGACAANRDETPVFVVGMPRSGTTLAEQILAAHPEVFGAGERASLEWAFYKLGGVVETPRAAARIAALGAPALEREAQLYLQELRALAPGAARIVDKMPNNFRILGLAMLMFPKAKIIWCLRDPRDIGLSIYSLRFYGHHPYAHDLDDLGWYIGQHRILLRHWQAVMPDSICTVQLADWVENFPLTLKRLTNFLSLDYNSACERFYLSDRPVRTASRTQVRQPVNARGIGRWRHFERQLAPLLESLEANGAYEVGM